MLLLAGAASVFVVVCTLELGLRARRRERSILDLLGASAATARAPTVIEGLAQGLAGALGAVGILAGLYAVGADVADQVLARAFALGSIEFLPARELAALVVAGAGFGLLGGFLASRGARR
jgi:cell division transport system permease protein